MKKQAGFTLVELMVVIAIMGILAATAVGFVAKYRQRTVGSEATVMMKQLLEAEIIYFLGHETFFPNPPGIIEIRHDGTAKLNGSDDPTIIQDTLDAISVAIPVGHLLDFNITSTGDMCGVTISSSASANFDLFPGATSLIGTVDKTGKMTGPTPF